MPHGASMYRRGCRCEECKAGALAQFRVYAAKVKAATGKSTKQIYSPARPKSCPDCGKQIAGRARSTYCTQCGIERRKPEQAELKMAQRRARGVKPARRRQAEMKLEKAARGVRHGYSWVEGPCAICGARFTSTDSQARYCSTDCRKRAHSGRWIDYLDRVAIYRRDDWTCQICGEVTEPDAEPTSSWYPSLDHIIPRSQGGPDDWQNLRTAHNWCNSVRGDLSIYSDSDLVA